MLEGDTYVLSAGSPVIHLQHDVLADDGRDMCWVRVWRTSAWVTSLRGVMPLSYRRPLDISAVRVNERVARALKGKYVWIRKLKIPLCNANMSVCPSIHLMSEEEEEGQN